MYGHGIICGAAVRHHYGLAQSADIIMDGRANIADIH